MTAAEKIQRLQDCIALLMDVDVMQQAVLGDTVECEDNHNMLEDLIEQFSEKLEDLQNA